MAARNAKFAARIHERGLNQRQLAEKIGTNPARISNIMRGFARPNILELRKICMVLRCHKHSIDLEARDER